MTFRGTCPRNWFRFLSVPTTCALSGSSRTATPRLAPDFWLDQGQSEWLSVLKGAARFQFEDGMVEIKVGDFINLPATGVQEAPGRLDDAG